MNNPQVEVRVITFRRPAYLHRALACLTAQTHVNWKAVVFDDSSGAEGCAVVQAHHDHRVEYRMNPGNLGMVRNTSQAFAPKPYFHGSRYACVLEDDNLFDPMLLVANVAALQKATFPVLARNYRVTDIAEDGSECLTGREPMRELWGGKACAIEFRERVREAFFTFTLGNLGYFWELNRNVDLSVPEEKYNGPVSEATRSISFSEACWYEPEPMATFSRFVCKAQTPRSETPFDKHLQRVAKVSDIHFTQKLLRIWTRDLHCNPSEILKAAGRRTEGEDAIQRVAEAGCLSALPHLKTARAWIKVVKATGVSWIYRRNWRKMNGGEA